MPSVTISNSAISAFIPQLSPKPSSSSTHLPTILPLAFPTPTHLLNTLTVLHLVHAVLSRPAHTKYFISSSSDPSDTATRGVLGLYLSSGEEWTADNLLGTEAWKKGRITEERVTEIFGVETTQEREHETMKGIRVGGRWEEGARLSESLVELFKDLGQRLDGKARCIGEVVREVISRNREETSDVIDFVKACCEEAVSFVPSFADQYTIPDLALPSAPLRLLQDLAYRQEQYGDLDVTLPLRSELADISPLPLSLSALLCTEILVVSPENPDLSKAIHELSAVPSSPSRDTKTIAVEPTLYSSLQVHSIEACRLIRDQARQDGLDVTLLEVALACDEKERKSQKEGRNLHLVLDT